MVIVRYTLECSIGKYTLKSLNLVIALFFSSFIILNLMIYLMYVDTSRPKLGIPLKVELANARVNS
jgi:hypothetical protein